MKRNISKTLKISIAKKQQKESFNNDSFGNKNISTIVDLTELPFGKCKISLDKQIDVVNSILDVYRFVL